MTDIWNDLIQGLTYGSMYALAACSIALIFKATKLFNFATGALVMISGYTLAAFQQWVPNFWLAAAVSVTLVAAMAGLFYWHVPRKMLLAPHWVTMVSTLGFAIAIEGIAGAIWLGRTQTVSTPWQPTLVPMGFGAQVSNAALIQTVIVLVVIGALLLVLRSPGIGAAFRAAADEPALLAVRGISPFWFYIAAWLLGGALAALAGVFYASGQSAGLGAAAVGFAAFPAAIIGGLDSVSGALIAGLGLGVVQVLSANYLTSSAFFAIAFFLAIGVLLMRPSGLLGSPEVTRV